MHQLQGKAERLTVKPPDLLALLRDFYLDKLALTRRHEAGAREVSAYDVNNAYQNIINRDYVHLSWLEDALTSRGSELPSAPDVPPLPAAAGPDLDKARAVSADDARLVEAFVVRWRDRVEQVTPARDKLRLRVILGEALEHKRMLEQATAGRPDLLGRRADGAGTGGGVLPTRWIE